MKHNGNKQFHTMKTENIQDSTSELVPALSETLTQYATIFLISSQAHPAFPPIIPLGSTTGENPADTVERNTNLHFLYIHLIMIWWGPG